MSSIPIGGEVTTKRKQACALETLRDSPRASQTRQRLECGGLLPLCYWVLKNGRLSTLNRAKPAHGDPGLEAG